MLDIKTSSLRSTVETQPQGVVFCRVKKKKYQGQKQQHKLKNKGHGQPNRLVLTGNLG